MYSYVFSYLVVALLKKDEFPFSVVIKNIFQEDSKSTTLTNSILVLKISFNHLKIVQFFSKINYPNVIEMKLGQFHINNSTVPVQTKLG